MRRSGHAQGHDPNLRMGRLQSLRQVGPESVHDGALLHRDQHPVLLGQRLQHGRIHRLQETAVHHGAVEPVARQELGRFQRRQHHGAGGQDGDVFAAPQLFPGSVRHGRDLRDRTELGRSLVARDSGC